MPNFNKVTLMGNITRDMELRYTTSGTPVVDIGLAVNTKRKDTTETLFIDCTIWSKAAEIVSQYANKGDPLLVHGRLTMDQWEKDGKKFSKIKMVVDDFQFISNRDAGGAGGGGGRSSGGGGNSQGSAPAQNNQPQANNNDFGAGDDIPF